MGKPMALARQPQEDMHAVIGSMDAKSLSQSVVEAELLRTLNDLYSARRSRLLAASEGVPASIWWILGLGAAITVAFSFFRHAQHAHALRHDRYSRGVHDRPGEHRA
jgi:hypothetical protein